MTLKLASLLTGLFFIAAAFFAPPTLAQDLCVRPTDPGCFRDPDTGQFIRDDGFRGSIPEINEFKESVEQNNREGKVSIGNTVGNNVLESTFAGVYCGLTDSQSCPRKPNSVAFTTSMSRMIAGMMTQPPATTETYVADLLNSAGVPLAQPAYAQGFGGLGFNSLIPILEAWKTFRNLAYMFFVIIFLVIGFMIMFRQKIGSQTVVTAQQAIPQIIIALLTVTFSYAIAGLLIDVMYLFMALMIAVFDLSDQTYLNLNVFTLGGTMIKGGASVGYDAVDNFINNALGVEGGDAALDVLSDGAEIVGGFAAAVIIAIAITIQVFRLFIELLKTYVSIIISITLSPLLLMTEAIPGRHTFFPWVKSLVANLAAFPTILLLLIIFDKLTGGFTGTTPQIEDGGFSPPFLIGLGGPGAGVIPFLIGFGMLMIMPTLVQQVKKALGAGGGIFEQFGQAFGDSVKLGWKGGELIPGMAWTDTSRMPVIGSGKDFFRKTGIATSGVAGGAYGALWEAPRRRAQGQRDISRWTQLRSRADQFARKAGSSMSDPHIKEKKADEKKPHK